MHRPSIYVETSVWSYVYADDAPESRQATIAFFDRARKRGWELAISEVVITELARAGEELGRRFRELLEDVRPARYGLSDQVAALAAAYLAAGAIPPAKAEDAQHVAVAVVHELDVLVSWNYRHLVNVRRREAIQHVSAMNGYYKPLHIVTPPEVPDDEGE